MHRASSLIYRKDDDSVRFSRPDVGVDDDLWIGRIVDARYRVLERIGHGGMGVVYKIVHERMGKIAAMKVLHRELSSEKEVVQRFRREAQAVSRLSHPNTVQVFDFGTARGALYLVMEFVRGDDLGTLIKRDGPMSFERAAAMFHQTCAALSEAHALGIVHRDLKPENIIITRTRDGDDFAKVLDFGLAKIQEREDLAEVTDSGSIVGTPYYMSPEQIRGENIDARADIYSLGALMYRVLTGEPPFRAQSPVGVLTKHLTAELVPPSERRPELQIDERVDALIVRAMQKHRDDRYATIDEMRHAIELLFSELTGDTPPSLSPSGGHLRRGGSASRPRRVFAGANLALDIDYGIDPAQRLNREDIDHFERRMVRRRLYRILGIPVLVIGAAAAAAYWFLLRPEGPRSYEVEPNNDPETATLIASGTPVKGLLGKRISKTAADKDVFVLREHPTADGAQAVTISLSAIPNIDTTVQLYDRSGKYVTKSDEGGVGMEEWIRNYRVNEPMMIVITESPGAPMPTENVSDEYTLIVTLATIDGTTEVEPNDMDSNSVPLSVDRPVTGYLDRRGDVDAFRFNGANGTYEVRVDGADDAPLLLRRGTDGPLGVRAAKLKLENGDVLRIERDESNSDARIVPTKVAPYSITVTPAGG
jgi:serine/threonine-protein kinase